MSFYPSLEDMKVDQLTRAQLAHLSQQHQQQQQVPVPVPSSNGGPNEPVPIASSAQPATNPLPYPVNPPKNFSALYPALNDYMGLDLTPQFLVAANITPNAVAVPQPAQVAIPVAQGPPSNYGMIAPISGGSVGLHRAEVSHGIREVSLCKDRNGKIGMKVKDVNKGVFIILVQKNSPAALAGLRFGDQILQVNGVNVAGYDSDKMHAVFRKCSNNNIVVAVRDRPFERTITMHKGSAGHIGFLFKNGKIFSIVTDSSAARNGVLTDHHLLEVNGQNVIGLKDKDITQIVNQGGDVITITIMPSFIYEHMMKHIATFLVKEQMDHSIKDL